MKYNLFIGTLVIIVTLVLTKEEDILSLKLWKNLKDHDYLVHIYQGQKNVSDLFPILKGWEKLLIRAEPSQVKYDVQNNIKDQIIYAKIVGVKEQLNQKSRAPKISFHNLCIEYFEKRPGIIIIDAEQSLKMLKSNDWKNINCQANAFVVKEGNNNDQLTTFFKGQNYMVEQERNGYMVFASKSFELLKANSTSKATVLKETARSYQTINILQKSLSMKNHYCSKPIPKLRIQQRIYVYIRPIVFQFKDIFLPFFHPVQIPWLKTNFHYQKYLGIKSSVEIIPNQNYKSKSSSVDNSKHVLLKQPQETSASSIESNQKESVHYNPQNIMLYVVIIILFIVLIILFLLLKQCQLLKKKATLNYFQTSAKEQMELTSEKQSHEMISS